MITLATLITPQDATNAVLTRNERNRIRGAVQSLAQAGQDPAGAAAAQGLALLVPAR